MEDLLKTEDGYRKALIVDIINYLAITGKNINQLNLKSKFKANDLNRFVCEKTADALAAGQFYDTMDGVIYVSNREMEDSYRYEQGEEVMLYSEKKGV